MITSQQFAALLQKWREGTLSEPDTDQLLSAWQSGLYHEWTGELLETHLEAGDLHAATPPAMKEHVLAKLRQQYDTATPVSRHIAHRVHFLRYTWFRAAVAILLFAGISVYVWQSLYAPNSLVQQQAPIQNEVPAGGNKATLILADGSVIHLDSVETGRLANEAGATIQKSANGEIIYAFDKTTAGTNVSYNTLTTPRGGTYQVVLPDGSKVWLNAESSVRFPTVFTGNVREIEMTGEAYYEIKPNSSKPFIIKAFSDQIQVLGTSFNVHAYKDALMKTSLLEGSVKVNNHILKPGQAFTNGNVTATNIEQDIAWKNGVFDFNNLDGAEAMKQLGRWYDVKFVFDPSVTKIKFWGELDRSLTLDQVLRGLEGIGGLHFELKQKTVTVTTK